VQLAESTGNELAKRVLMDIADEEIVHAGEFMRLLKELAPGEEALYAEGALEVEEMIDALKGEVTPAAGDVVENAAPSLTVGSLMDNE
jgi:rubrerythrin